MTKEGKKKNYNEVAFLIVESETHEKVKSKYIVNLFQNFLQNQERYKKPFTLIKNTQNKIENGEFVPLEELYHFIFVFTSIAREDEQFYKEVLFKIFDVIFHKRTSQIESFYFLYSFFISKKVADLNLTYEVMVKIIKKIASLFDSFSEDRKQRESEIFLTFFLNVLVNLRNKIDVNAKTIRLEGDKYFSATEEKRKMLLDAIEPCYKEIRKIAMYNLFNFYQLLAITNLRDEKFENIILQTAKSGRDIPGFYYFYVEEVRGGRFEELEEFIKNNPRELKRYLQKSLRKRAPELEPYILQDPESCVLYAEYALHGNRFIEGEDVIAKEAEASYYYAANVLHARFPKGEKAISQEEYWKKEYKKLFKIQKFK